MDSLIGMIVAFLAAGSPPGTVGIVPPPALLSARSGLTWMQRGSSCWTGGGRGMCVDTAGFGSAPVVRLRTGETITIELGFRPRRVELTAGGRTYRLPSSRRLRWRVRGRAGELSVFAYAAPGSASYGVRVSHF